jgi:O-antigen ligase
VSSPHAFAPAWPNVGPAISKPRKHAWDDLGFAVVWILAFAIPWGDMVLLPYQVQASRVFSVAAGLFWLIALIRGRKMRAPEAAHWALFLFVICSASNLAWTAEPEKSFRRILSYSQLFIVACLVHQAARTVRQYHSLLAAYLLGTFVAIAGQLYNFARGVTTGDGRFTAPGFDPNDLAMTIVLGIPLAWHMAVRRRVYVWLATLYIPIAITGCLMTASRGALVTLTVALLYPLTTLPKLRRRSWIALGLILVGSIGVFSALKDDISFHRLRTITRELNDRDLNGRVDIWQRGFDAFVENPVLGTGAGTFSSAVGSWRIRDIAAHNTLLGILVEHGVVGLSLFISILGALFWRSSRGDPAETRLWIFMLLSWSVAATTLSWENRELTWLIWGLCMADPLIGLSGQPRRQKGYAYVGQKVWA